MSTAHKDPEMVKEIFDTPAIVEAKAKQVAQLVRNSKHAIIFTGAGISTSAGIPDFRGPEGVWTLRAQGKAAKSRTTSLQAIPTTAHMSVVKLVSEGIVKHVISQNTDGLHRKSGLNPVVLSELHGNSNIEICTKCKKEYLRDFRAVASYAKSVHDHITGRKCDKCGGDLQDTIINFQEALPRKPLSDGFMHAEQADLCIVMGSSLTVSPACDMPARVAERGKQLVICNLQKTPLDPVALKVYARSDDFMAAVMKELGISIPQWQLHRRVVVHWDSRNQYIAVRGIDWEGIHASILSSVDLSQRNLQDSMSEEPFIFKGVKDDKATVTLHFMGHYAEPELALEVHKPIGGGSIIFALDYDPYTRTWKYNSE